MQIDEKWDHLRSLLSEMRSVILAYSGGVDSSVLLRAASETLGQNVIAVTAVSETYPAEELHLAKRFAASLGVRHRILQTEELGKEEFTRNAEDRCYHCKQELFGKLRQIAEAEGITWILDGSNTDDQRDFRPGRKAAQRVFRPQPSCGNGSDKTGYPRSGPTSELAYVGQAVPCLPFFPNSLRNPDHLHPGQEHSGR